MNSITQITSTKISRRPWTVLEDQQLMKLLLSDMHYGDIGNALERTYSSINNRAIKLGFYKTRPNLPVALNGTQKKSKPRRKVRVKTNNVNPLLKSKIKTYRIIVGALAVAQAATLTMLVI